MNYFKKIFNTLVSNDSPSTTEAEAIILQYSFTGATINNLKELNMLLQVMPKTGRNFITESRSLITPEQESCLCIGYKMNVTLDFRQPNKIIPPAFL